MAEPQRAIKFENILMAQTTPLPVLSRTQFETPLPPGLIKYYINAPLQHITMDLFCIRNLEKQL